MRLWKNSLPLRLAVITGTVFIVVLITALLASFLTTDYLLKSSVDSTLTSLARSIADSWTRNNGPQNLPIRNDKDSEVYVQVVDSQGTVVYTSSKEDYLPVEGDLLRQALQGKEFFTDAVGRHRHRGRLDVSALSDREGSLWPEKGGVRIIYWPLPESKEGNYVLQVGLPVKEQVEMLLNLGKMLIVISIGAVLIVVGVSAFLVWNTFKPLRQIIAVAEEIDGSTLTSRIEVPVRDATLNHLVEVLNAMLKRLETAFLTQARFVNDAAHDLRTPLSALRSELEITLRQTRSENEYIQALKGCLTETEYMGSLTENLLALAKFDSGLQMEIEKAIPLGPLLERVNSEFRELAEQNQITLIMDFEKNLRVDCDQLAIERLLRNLLDNGIRYTPAGGLVELVLRDKSDLKGCGGAEITIRDTGIGIGSQDLPHIFERFYRSDGARRRDGGGSGLGLSICRSIVLNHGGAIHIQSERGKGTCVAIWLPCTSS
ncbi:signal transduction histidine kinase [Desulfosporosinus orientis DSM 765]|uniref:histidine kinase n=1 Tax=Desulfosporosinus orientis (strain ATCC 19365 / DSM 765 / NCIMB 8382 / VKM B-1628 / Singapore I) TaxID=768706 RepID=G7W8Z9_DESOD|nr:ATP-binding protein [Desulfosporosinus orientis]AET68208.1 signal transduction histidine kinase [Desulfosporosinus orientis DSM 765]